MKPSAAPPEAEPRSYGAIIILGLIVVAFVAIVAAVVMRREPDYALVLATPQDCLRAFDDIKCREIVARAVAIHSSSAPRYADQGLCELGHGAGGCMPVTLLNDNFYAPSIAAIIVSRGAIDDPKAMAPLYASRDGNSDDGRRVYYGGLAVGILRDKRFGGAQISLLTDLKGQPITSETIKHLRR